MHIHFGMLMWPEMLGILVATLIFLGAIRVFAALMSGR